MEFTPEEHREWLLRLEERREEQLTKPLRPVDPSDSGAIEYLYEITEAVREGLRRATEA